MEPQREILNLEHRKTMQCVLKVLNEKARSYSTKTSAQNNLGTYKHQDLPQCLKCENN